MAKDFEDWASFIGRISQSVAKLLQSLQRLRKTWKIRSRPSGLIEKPCGNWVSRPWSCPTLAFPRFSLNQESKHLETVRLAAQAGTSMFHKFPAMEDLCSPVPENLRLVTTERSYNCAAAASAMAGLRSSIGILGQSRIAQKLVLNSPLQQAALQAQKSLNLLGDASVSIKPSLESMRLATEVSTSMSHKFPAMADLYSLAPTRIPIAIRTLQSTQLASVAKSLSVKLAAEASTSIRPFLESIKPVSESLASLAGPSVALTQAVEMTRSFSESLQRNAGLARLASEQFSPALLRLSETAELQRSAIESARESLDQAINISFISTVSPVSDLHSFSMRQMLDGLNLAGSLGSIAGSIVGINSFTISSVISNINPLKNDSFDSSHRFWLLTEVIIKLANLGWFLGRKILQDLPTDPLEILKSTDPANITKIMCRYFRKKLDTIANELINNYPERQNLLRKTFQAHRQGHYDFSIPLFLSHADGISRHRFGGEVFMKKGRKTIATHSLSLHAEYLISNELLPIWASQANRSNDPSILNRHQIVHGESIDYGNELNSLRTISFLYWIHCLAQAKH